MSLAVAVALPLTLLFGAHPDPRFRAGVLLHDAGKYAGAITLYRQVLADRPHDAAAVYELGLSLVANRQLDEAIALVDAELKSSVAQTPRLFVVQASAYDGRGEPERAEAALRRGLAADPANPELTYLLGVNQARRERWPEAIAAFAASADADPGNPSGWSGLGRAYEAQHELPRAVAAYARAALTVTDPRRAQAAAARVVALSPSGEALVRTLREQGGVFFGEVRAAGHLEALSYEVRRRGGDAAAELWCAEHAAELAAWKRWQERRR
jgi:tetratricopeptide (TPR) repeat protein